MTLIMASIGALVVVLIALAWRGGVSCFCSRATRRPPRHRHRTLLQRSPSSLEWLCSVCFHKNQQTRQTCILCGSSPNDVHVVIPSDPSASALTDQCNDSFMLIETPRSKCVASSEPANVNDRQCVALERHEWKRYLQIDSIRWIRVPFDAVNCHESLRGTIVSERTLRKIQRKDGEDALAATNFDPAYCCAHEESSTLRWIPAEDYRIPVKAYVCHKDIERASSRPFSDKIQWFYSYELKYSIPPLDGDHTIRVHREHVLKQSVEILLTAPPETLRRNLRVTFMDEPGIDAGGILREWVHLVCKHLFAEELGIFQRTNTTHGCGYWINPDASKVCRNHVQFLSFFGKLIGKALLDGLILDVRLCSPLLKQLLGYPLGLHDVRFLDERIHKSLVWVLQTPDISSLDITFQWENVELIPGGANIPITDDNKHLFIVKVVHHLLFSSVEKELGCILDGLRTVIPDTTLHIFDYQELDLLLSGQPTVDVDDWRKHTSVQFTGQHKDLEKEIIEWFWEVVEAFSQDQRCRLLQYVTGSCGVPAEGFQGLTGINGDLQSFTIQLVEMSPCAYAMLPYASTCMNRLDLPLYGSRQELEENLTLARNDFADDDMK
ncbi:TPA: hypothetical protein N0F65_011655 [Lagenidium giganteum]|uniref:HECT-type E3 ubiquitin transferase n=1 Tax=Lagenidium giganteum TaxID=4803 RepID=A0AAV2Z7F8_9STRA|nr:TPA: hypothetical protein N0F65_011655 [Lagenidium giganteum]